MKKIIVLILLLCVAGFTHAEMLINGNFENGSDSWNHWGSGSGSGSAGYLWWSGSASFAPSGGSDGGQHAIVDTTPMTGYFEWWGWNWQGVWQDDVQPVTTGDVLAVNAYLKNMDADGPTEIHVFFEWEDSDGLRVDLDGDGVRGADNDNQDDRTNIPVALVGDGSWEKVSMAVTVPEPLGEGIIAQFNYMWSIEGLLANVGIDELSITKDAAVNVYPPDGAKYVPINAVLEWGPPPTFVPLAYDVYRSITDPNADKPKDQVVFHANQTTYDDPLDMEYVTLYYWRVNVYDPCDVIRSPGSVWTFTTWPVEPIFSTDAESTSVEAGSSAQIYVKTPRSNDFQWYKDGTPDTEVNDGDDGGDVSVVSDANSSTLTISNAEQADEAYYYCVATGNGSTESNHARLLIKRLMGHWKFDAMSLNDAVAGNHGTLTDPNANNPPPPPPSGPTWFAPGAKGGAIKLETGELYIDIPNPEYFNFHAQGFTVSAWIKTEQADWGAIVSKADRLAPQTGWVLQHNGNTAHMTLRSGTDSDYEATFGGVELTDNEWHMLVGTYDEQTGMLSLYVDGEKRSETGPFWTLSETDMALKIGTELSSDDPDLEDTNPFTGWMDDVKILSYAQDGYEIATEYTDIAGGSVCVEPVPGDLNDDCVINTGDAAIVALEWLRCNLIPTSACD